MKYIKIIGEFVLLLLLYLFLKYKFDSSHRINIVNPEIYIIFLFSFSMYFRKLKKNIIFLLVGSILLPILAFLAQGIFYKLESNYLHEVFKYYYTSLYILSILAFIYFWIIMFLDIGNIGGDR